MKNIYCFVFIALAGLFITKAQNPDEIQWKTWPELEQALKKEPKPVFIFFHADWCVYCKKIERVVFNKLAVIQKINKNYYAVEMNVESTDTITFDTVEFKNTQARTQRNSVHEIALLLASRKGQPFSLPATLILNEDFTVKKRIFEYYTAQQLLKVL
ncbi:thioredoxin family protein [Marixanthomonas spongiae]|uniref:Thioredoxin family protein n=1 Tax=Marixanthomonas spongiae TaxID=2174845 RepID=A0A2U0I1T3_9FLAO|nr:thioredoxin family protein [Marixanthomonas spongiae]PVW15055.1 thioredoxin family protein [Marixanthomonas spongiae]